MPELSGDRITFYECGRAIAALAQLRLVQNDAVVGQISYATEGGTDSMGRTENPVLAEDITDGNTLVTIAVMTDGDIMTCISSEAIAIDTRVQVADVGRVKAIDTNATPVAQNIIGRTREAVTAANRQILVRLYREVITQ